MEAAVIVGPGLPRRRRAAAREAFGGALFQAHIEIAGALALPTLLASPDGPVPLDREIVGHRWPTAAVAASVARWAATAPGPVLALADDDDALAWREATRGRVLAPLVGTSPLQRRLLVSLLGSGAELPSWTPPEFASVLATRRPAPPPAPGDPEEQASETRHGALRMRTIRAQAPVMRLLFPEANNLLRPKTRADCTSVPRPCPFVGCRHNLYLEIAEHGGILLRQAGVEPWDVTGPSCVLDVVEERGALLLSEVGEILGVSRERARQIEQAGLEALGTVAGITEIPEDGPVGFKY